MGVTVKEKYQKGQKYILKLQPDQKEETFEVECDNLDEDNEKLPPLRNPPILEAAEDLTSLLYLNEPAVLHAIKVRYSQLNIYTYSGIVLIATNPFQRVDHLYSQDIVQAYAGKRRGDLDPHLFAIAEEAYRCMKVDSSNQTIVVSGESGAGKTVSAKYIMRYFASVEEEGELDSKVGTAHTLDMSDVERQILATNPITEAFGNAKTTRNDNSSRFGKYLEILFDDKTSIIGARVRTYLLERSRLVFQPLQERNYHIFYQILAGMNEDQKAALGLTSASDFRYTNQGESVSIPGVDDAKEFELTQSSLALIGVDAEKQYEIYRLLAALLHIGNIEISATRNDAHLSPEEPNLVKACELLRIDPNNFSKWCIKKQITTRSEKIVTNLNHQQAVVARDSFAKYIYAALFDWLVDYINADLCPSEVAAQVKSFIGVLDIYGFEHFEKNSFEQFCINYANEKLQQEFNQHVFKLEQEEYVKEEIEWSFIDFADNQPCINLIENKLGILSLLDEESRMPSGNDSSWIEKMYQTLDKPPTNKVFSKPRFGRSKFVVSHYALDVTYDSEGFIEKNRDTVGEGHLEVLKASENEMLQDVLSVIDKNSVALETSAKKSIASKKPTLGSMFKTSLIDLMKTINETNVHYIRCIKPNEQKKAWEFDSLMVLSQLRACGVLETIRISCAGFPSRWTYVEFADRYHILLNSEEWMKVMSGEKTQESVSNLCFKILSSIVEDKEKYQLGNTKIFFKAGMLAHFEKMRADKLHKSAVMIQKNVKKRVYRQQYLIIRASHTRAQALFKGHLERLRIKRERESEAATRIQTVVRGYLARRQYNCTRDSILLLQRAIRSKFARRVAMEQQKSDAAIVLQKLFRGFQARKDFTAQRKAAVVLQSGIRRKFAQRELGKLRVEAKSVSHFKEVSYKLENKVVELTHSLTSKIEENKRLVTEITNLKGVLSQSASAAETLKTREMEFGMQLGTQTAAHRKEVEDLRADLSRIKDEYDAAEKRVEQLSNEQADLRQRLQSNIEELNAVKDALVQRDTIEVDLKSHIEQLKAEITALKTNQPLFGKTRGGVSKRRNSTHSLGSEVPFDLHQRPVSVIAVSNDEQPNVDDINDELFRLLRDSKKLHREIIDGLLKGLKIPAANVASDLTRKEVLFPARIIIIILSDMWRLGLTRESEEFLGDVLAAIQQIVGGLKEDHVIPHGAFWLSNTHELYSFVLYAEQSIIDNDSLSQEMSKEEFDEYLKLVAVVKEDFESLSFNIYNMWMKKMEKNLEKKAVSAVVLSQSLPGFMAEDNSPFLAKVFSPGTQYKMDDVLAFFNTVFWSMKLYFVEVGVRKTVIVELLKFVDAISFNDLILRKSFLSWKRGLQLNYNVTRLAEWCKGHELEEGSFHLNHLLQTAKLLQLRKNTIEDMDIIQDICFDLTPAQIQRLISLYHMADYETPISPEVMQTLANKVKQTQGSNGDLFEVVSTDGHFEDPFRNVELRPFSRVEAYVPAWLVLPVIRRIVELVAKNASVTELAVPDMKSYPLQNGVKA